MVNYKDLGLVNTRDMFAKAIKGGYAIPAFNFNNMDQTQEIESLLLTKKDMINKQLGDLKPMEYPITLFMNMAWNPERYAAGNLLEHTRACLAQGKEALW